MLVQVCFFIRRGHSLFGKHWVSWYFVTAPRLLLVVLWEWRSSLGDYRKAELNIQVFFHGSVHFATHFSAFQGLLLHARHHVPDDGPHAPEPSAVSRHIDSAWAFQRTWRVSPGLSNTKVTCHLAMSLWWRMWPHSHCFLDVLWTVSALACLRAYKVLVLYTTYSRNTCHHTSIKVLPPALKWVLEFPMVLHFCDFLP